MHHQQMRVEREEYQGPERELKLCNDRRVLVAHGIEHLNGAETHLRADHVTGDLEAREQQSHRQTNRQSDQKLAADPSDDQGRIRRQARQVNDRRQDQAQRGDESCFDRHWNRARIEDRKDADNAGNPHQQDGKGLELRQCEMQGLRSAHRGTGPISESRTGYS